MPAILWVRTPKEVSPAFAAATGNAWLISGAFASGWELRDSYSGCGWALRHYGVYRSQLGAARSRKSFALPAEDAGCRIERISYDSNEHQILISELYASSKCYPRCEAGGALRMTAIGLT